MSVAAMTRDRRTSEPVTLLRTPSAKPRTERKLVLFPHGQPESIKHRTLCSEYVLRCGGDLSRVIDAPSDSVERFASYVSRIRGLREGAEAALVVLTRTNPLALTVIDGRKRLEAAVPTLRRALWAIYIDPDEDPFFLSTAERYGTLGGAMDTAPIWVGPGPSRFLVMSSLVRQGDLITERAQELLADTPDETGVRRIARWPLLFASQASFRCATQWKPL